MGALLLLDSLLKHCYLSFLLESELLGPHLHVVPLLDAKKELSELHVLFEVRFVHVGLERALLVVLVMLASLLIADLRVLCALIRSRVLGALLLVDHLLDFLGGSLFLVSQGSTLVVQFCQLAV